MPVRLFNNEISKYEVYYASDEEISELPPIDNNGKCVPKRINPKKLIHGADNDSDNDSDSLEEEDSEDESMSCTQDEPPAMDPPVQAISDLVTKDMLLYDGFCFNGATNQLSSVSDFKVDGFGPVQIPLVNAQVEKLLRVNKPRVTFNPTFSTVLDQLKAEVANKIGCSPKIFKLVFKKMMVHQTGAEVARQKDKELVRNQFGKLFLVPPTKQTGLEMKVYRKLNVEGDQEEIALNVGAESSNWHYGFISAEAEHEIARVTSVSRLVFVFAAVWETKQQPTFPGPEHIGQIVIQLKVQSAKGDFLVAFLDETYDNFKNVGERALNNKDQSLLRQLKASNNRLKKPFKIGLVSVVRNFSYQEYNNEEELDDLYGKYFFETIDVDWKFESCNILQQWFDLDGNPWPKQPKANLELMTNVMNPKKMSLKQLWGSDAMQDIQGKPSQSYYEDQEYAFYSYGATKTVTYKRSLLVLWPPELAFERVAEFEGWDVAFNTLIGKTSDSAVLTSLLQLFKEKKGYKDTKELIKDETVRFIYDYITKKCMFDLLPVYIDVFFATESAVKLIFLTSNEEIWKITESALLSDLDDPKAVRIIRLLEIAQQVQAPKERRYKLLQACLPKKLANADKKAVLRLVLPLADDDLIMILGEKLRSSTNLIQPFLNALLMPEFAPLREEKFWSILFPALKQRMEWLKPISMKPFDKNHPDLEAIFPKESAQAKWLMQCSSYEETCPLNVEDNDPKKAEQVVEQLKTYNLIFSAKLQAFCKGGVQIILTKTENFKRHQQKLKGIKTELQTLIDMEKQLKDDGDLKPPTKKQKTG